VFGISHPSVPRFDAVRLARLRWPGIPPVLEPDASSVVCWFCSIGKELVMSWRTLMCSAAMVVFCVGAGWLLGQGLAWGAVCNKKPLKSATKCDSNFPDGTDCGGRSSSDCEASLGADYKATAPSWAPGCNSAGSNKWDHCVMQSSDQNCLQKYYCDYSYSFCGLGAAYSPTSYWTAPKAISPSCTPAT